MYLGNLDSKRDWGYAPEYTDMMWRMLQQDTPGDYVCATGETNTIRDFCIKSFAEVGIHIRFEGNDVSEEGVDIVTGKTLIKIDPRYFRPAEVDLLLGDATKAREKLGWTSKVTFEELVKIMTKADWELAKKEQNI